MNDADRREKFYRLVWPHMATVARMARYLAANDADGEDLAQEAMLKAYRAIDTFQGNFKVQAWLMTILRHAHVDAVRAARCRSFILEQVRADIEDTPPTQFAEAEASEPLADPDQVLQQFSDQDLIRAVRSLPKEIRWTLLLVDVQGLDHSDAASVLGVPLGTVKSRAHRGRAMLKGLLVGAEAEPRRYHQLSRVSKADIYASGVLATTVAMPGAA